MKQKTNPGPLRGSRVKQSTVKQFICLVDSYRRPSRRRNTAGRYRVGAKNARQARQMLQSAIGTGSVQVYYQETGTCGADRAASYGECLRETFPNGGNKAITSPAVRFDMPMRERSA